MEPKPAYPMSDLEVIFGSRQRVYDLGNARRLRLKKLGKLTIATHDAVIECLNSLPDYEPGTSTLPNPKKKASGATAAAA